MRIIIAKDYADLSQMAAEIIAGQIRAKPNSVIGLATGSTPLGMYRELIKIYQHNRFSFSEAVTFNLDEYVALGKADHNSYHYYMKQNFFHHVDIQEKNQHIPDGEAGNIEQECMEYEQKIKAAGGIDLQILGIGRNGHIGFNEPDVKFEAVTHQAMLDEETVKANARFFSAIDQVPRSAISMGIKTIMDTKKILLLVSGADKAEMVYRAVFGAISPEVPASILQLHPAVTVIVEEDAAKLLRTNRQVQSPGGGQAELSAG